MNYKEKRYFILFNLHENISKSIKKIGVKKIDSKKYYYDESIWVDIDPLDYFYDGLYILMRLPELKYDELWNLFINSKIDDNRIGALTIISNKYDKQLFNSLKNVFETNNRINKQIKNSIKEIKNFVIPSILDEERISILKKSQIAHNTWERIYLLLEFPLNNRYRL